MGVESGGGSGAARRPCHGSGNALRTDNGGRFSTDWTGFLGRLRGGLAVMMQEGLTGMGGMQPDGAARGCRPAGGLLHHEVL